MLVSSVLVTGANRGLGLEFVKQFVRASPAPKHILAVCRDPSKSTDLQALAASNPNVHIIAFEVTDPKQYDGAVASVREILGGSGLSLLINNAGIFDWTLSTLEQHTKENMMQHLDINLVTPVLITKAFLPLLKEAGAKAKPGDFSAAVVNISAILGVIREHKIFPGGYPYKYSKAAFNMATACLADDLKPSGILVMAIHPGWVQTDMGQSQAPLTPEQSISGCLKVIGSLGEVHRGKLYDWKGDEIPY